MKKSSSRKFFAAAIVFSLLVIAGGCQEQCKKSDKAQVKPAAGSQSKQSDVKQYRPAATGNIDIKKQIAVKDEEIAKLKDLLEEKDKEIESLGKQIIDSLVDSSKLKEENDNLKKQIEELKKGTGQ